MNKIVKSASEKGQLKEENITINNIDSRKDHKEITRNTQYNI